MIEPNYTYKAKILRAVDGDTVDADIDMGFKITAHQRLRLARIDTPELNSKDPVVRGKAIEAAAFTKAAVEGREVILVTTKSDLYGRYLAEVWYVDAKDGSQVNLSDKLLSLGLAAIYK